MSTDAQKLQIKQAVEKTRFGYTREQVLKEKGAYCHQPLKPGDHHEGLLVISHINGGGRHASENGMIIPGKTHDMDNLTVLCQRHDGMKDRIRDSQGMGIEGNSNNPSQ
jgi:hypothetical protein